MAEDAVQVFPDVAVREGAYRLFLGYAMSWTTDAP
jgi:hypothetical protein